MERREAYEAAKLTMKGRNRMLSFCKYVLIEWTWIESGSRWSFICVYDKVINDHPQLFISSSAALTWRIAHHNDDTNEKQWVDDKQKKKLRNWQSQRCRLRVIVEIRANFQHQRLYFLLHLRFAKGFSDNDKMTKQWQHHLDEIRCVAKYVRMAEQLNVKAVLKLEIDANVSEVQKKDETCENFSFDSEKRSVTWYDEVESANLEKSGDRRHDLLLSN